MAEYLKYIFSKLGNWWWALVVGVFGLAEYIRVGDNWSWKKRSLVVFAVAQSVALIGLFLSGLALFKKNVSRLRVRAVVEGKHALAPGNQVVVIDNSPWVDLGQILTLVLVGDHLDFPLCLLRVITRTTKGLPACEVILSLTDEDIPTYLKDSSRYKSLRALPLVSDSHFRRINI